MKTKQQKREEALERQSWWKKLPLQKKVEILDQRPGKSEKQREKLEQGDSFVGYVLLVALGVAYLAIVFYFVLQPLLNK